MSSGNIRNLRDTFLHFLADNLTGATIHPVRASKDQPQYNSLQVGSINITFHDATYSVRAPTTQFLTMDILHDDELLALDLEESLIVLLQTGAQALLLDYSGTTPVQVSNSKVFWNVDTIKFRTVASVDYFHRSSVLELYVRYA